jgi:hypothetical protein
MVVKTKPKIDFKLQKYFDKLLNATSKTLPHYERFLLNLTPELLDLFMQYFSYKFKYDLKEYQRMKIKYRNNHKMLIDWVMSVLMDYKDINIWKTNQSQIIRGIKLGEMYQIRYANYHHDPFPLAIFLNSYDNKHQNFHAVNLHYLLEPFRKKFIQFVLRMNQPRIYMKKDPILTYEMCKKILPEPSIAYRNYKASYIKVIEKINVKRWEYYINIDKRKVKFINPFSKPIH